MSNPRKFSLLSTLLVALMLVIAIGSGTHGIARADATELFISEYIEGSSFNKAIEIYNGTGSAVDLASGGYSLELYSNGAVSASQTIDLEGSVADGDVFVVVHGSADAAIQAVADLTSSSVINFNGDDAIVLRKAGLVIDAFGQIGVDPGSEWPGGGADDTLRRKVDVCAGDSNAEDAFDASIEWDSFPVNSFDGLGVHTADCVSSPASLVINEVLASTTGTDVEYIELYGAPGTPLDGLSLIYVESNDGASLGAFDFRYDFSVGETLGDNGFYLLGTTDSLESVYGVTPNAHFDTNSLENSSATIALVETASLIGSSVSGSEVVLDTVGITDANPSTFFFDAPVFGPDGTFFPAGVRRVVDGVDTDTVDDWVIADFNLGPANTPTAGTTSGETPSVIVNEVDSDTEGTDVLEFVELFDGGAGNTALDGLVVVFFNGSNDLSYASYDLDGFATSSDGYFLLGNTGVSPTPSIIFGSNGLQNGTDAVALYAADAADFPNNSALTTDNLIDAIVYDTNDADDAELLTLLNAGQPQVNEGANNSAAESNQRCPNGEGGGRNTDTYIQAAPTPGAANACDDGGGDVEIGMCFDPATHYIHEVQGSGAASPLVGQTVVVEGVVVGDFQNNSEIDNGDLNGFHLQEEDSDADADPATSEGVFIYAPGTPIDVSNGDVVRVLGAVSEFNELTEITSAELLVCDSGASVTPAVVTLPVDDVSNLEAFEGMSVTFEQDLYISEYFNYDRFGEIVLTAERQFQPTAIYEPESADAAALADLNSRSRITLDDGRTSQNPDPALHPDGDIFDLDNLFRGGDILRDVTGVMDYSFGLYRIQPTQGAEHIEDNPRTATPEDVGGDIQVASFNVLNYFVDIDTGADICGPSGDMECRGADTQEELERQRAKIVAAIAAMDADVVGLIEIQNDEGAATEDLVNALNDMLGAGTYDYIDTGYIGTDAIKQAFIYQPGEVTPVGDYAVLDAPEFVDPNNSGTPKNRPALAQTFMDHDSGGVFTAVVNHLKSKGSACGAGDDDPEQGNCNLTRALSAQVLADWLATDPTNSGDADFLIIGDLNAYDKEDPIDVLIANGYMDLVLEFQGEMAYSYVFDGQLGYLDHALANGNLFPQVTGTTVWHINADEPDLIDYDMTFKQDAQDEIYAPDPYRSSDHDPVIVGLSLNELPICDGAVPSIASIWPPDHQFVSIDILGVTDPDGDDFTITIDSIFQDEAVDAADSGNTAPDGMGVGSSTAEVRAERVGEGGNGRVYHIFFTATDTAGGSCSGEVLVSVPVARHMAAIDDGPLYDSTIEP